MIRFGVEGARMKTAGRLVLVSLLAGCGGTAPGSPASEDDVSQVGNPLLVESSLPYQLPRFDLIRDTHFVPAFERGMTEHLGEIEAIAGSSDAPTVENTLEAMERSGQLLGRVRNVFFSLASAHTNDALKAIGTEVAPKLAAHDDRILLDPRLFARVQSLYDRRDALGLDAEARRLVEEYYTDFVRAGAALGEADQARLRAINEELATLGTVYGQHVLDEANAAGLVVESRDDLAGLSASQLAAAEAAAAERGLAGQYVLSLANTSGQPVLASLTDRRVRERVMAASLGRGLRGGPFDTTTHVARMARLRAERARLLGYATHADYVIERQTAGSVDAVMTRLASLASAAARNAREEAGSLEALLRAGQAPGDEPLSLASWDWAFYTEKVRAQRYAFDQAELQPYFELDAVLVKGVFHAATRLFGITFRERTDLPVYHPDVRVFEVFEADGAPLGLFLADFYARPSKEGGAWMRAYVPQSHLLGTRAVVANHQNLAKPAAGMPTLLTLEEVETMFHEFGHALHGLLSDVRYPYFSGTAVPRDFVEFPSQVNEMWAIWPEVLRNYALHHETGAPMPAALLDKVLAAQTFNQGFATTEYLAAALLDMAWHRLPPDAVPAPEGVAAFEEAALRAAGVALEQVPPRYRSTYFLHVFSNDYSAGYYSYIWAEVLDADSVEWFKANGGLTRENGDHLRRVVLSRGGSVDAMDQYRAFTGREPDVRPLLVRRGLD